jgi:hypothetical protein
MKMKRAYNTTLHFCTTSPITHSFIFFFTIRKQKLVLRLTSSVHFLEMCFFRDSNTTLEANFLAILLSATLAVCLNKIPSASTSIVMQATPLLVDLMGFFKSKCSFWHSSFNSFAGWNTTVSGVIKGSKRGLIL